MSELKPVTRESCYKALMECELKQLKNGRYFDVLDGTRCCCAIGAIARAHGSPDHVGADLLTKIYHIIAKRIGSNPFEGIVNENDRNPQSTFKSIAIKFFSPNKEKV